MIARFSNVTYGATCISENTTYVDTGFDSQQLSYTVIRDNCRPQLYCEQSSLTCQWTKVLGSPCLYDQECESVGSMFHSRSISCVSSVPALTGYALNLRRSHFVSRLGNMPSQQYVFSEVSLLLAQFYSSTSSLSDGCHLLNADNYSQETSIPTLSRALRVLS